MLPWFGKDLKQMMMLLAQGIGVFMLIEGKYIVHSRIISLIW